MKCVCANEQDVVPPVGMASIAATAPGAFVQDPRFQLHQKMSHFMGEREVGGRSTVLSSACAESRACYIGVRGNLEVATSCC